MKTSLFRVALLFIFATSLRAGSVETRFTSDSENEKPAIDLFDIDASYVFESEISRGNVDFGKQDVFSASIEYAHRFHLSGPLYLRAGVSYGRFEFGDSGAPVPSHLQSAAGIVGIDYMVGKDLGAFLQVRPGFYTDRTFDSDSFDMPITAARLWILQDKKLYLLTGVNYAFLRGQYPVLPLVGLIWYPNDQWSVLAILPEPRVTYMPNKNLGIWLGGQLTGGSYRTEESATIFPRRLSNAQVDYSEYRAGLGVDFHCGKAVTLSVAGGYAFERRFDFNRAGFEYKADPAPYVRATFKAEF
ncbi:MAG: hypothetical protein ABI992_05555 [Chthoniobacterales bacterium]